MFALLFTGHLHIGAAQVLFGAEFGQQQPVRRMYTHLSDRSHSIMLIHVSVLARRVDYDVMSHHRERERVRAFCY